RVQVGRGEPEACATRLAADHGPLDDVRTPEEFARQLHLSRLEGATDAAAADRAVKVAHLLDLCRPDAQLTAGPDEQIGVPGPSPAEVEVRSDIHLLHPQPHGQVAPDELLLGH